MIPNHVPKELVIDFDYYRPGDVKGDIFLSYKKLHQGPDVFWSPHHGGHWVVTRGKDIGSVLTDHKKFSSHRVFIPTEKNRPPIIPIELDPPDHKMFRRLLDNVLTDAAVEEWTLEIRRLTEKAVTELLPRGECEFMGDFARKVPIHFFLGLCGLAEDSEKLTHWISSSVRPKDVNHVPEIGYIIHYISELIQKRRSSPGNDLISQFLNAEMSDGRKLTDQEAHGFIWGFLGAGLDTVTASQGWFIEFLANNPLHRKELRDHPELIDSAVDELFRRFSISKTARLVREETVLSGVTMKAEDPVLVITCLHALDERCFDRPLEVDFRRKNSHLNSNFSMGVHTCPGKNLARREIKIFLEEWLKHIPDFEVNGEVESQMGVIHTLTKLPLKWRTL